MFESKKRLKQIEEEKKQLEETKQQLEKISQQIECEKQQLLFIKEQLEDSTPKVDDSNIYVWQNKGLYSIVRLKIENIVGRNWGGTGNVVNAYESTLIDIFTDKVIYQRSATETIQREEYISGKTLRDGYYAFLIPLHEVDNNLLAYTNKQIPIYILQQLYYKLNNVNVNAFTLTKKN